MLYYLLYFIIITIILVSSSPLNLKINILTETMWKLFLLFSMSIVVAYNIKNKYWVEIKNIQPTKDMNEVQIHHIIIYVVKVAYKPTKIWH